MLSNPIIDKIERQQLRDDIPDFAVGDTIAVVVRVVEGDRERAQTFEGVVISRRNRGVHSSCLVRKISHGVGVERTFALHSRQIKEFKVVRRGVVRQAKIYYMRERSGKAARIKERYLTKEQRAANK